MHRAKPVLAVLVGFGQASNQAAYATNLFQAGNLFVADHFSGNVYEFTPTESKSTFASGFNGPTYLAFNSSGDLFVSVNNSSLQRQHLRIHAERG